MADWLGMAQVIVIGGGHNGLVCACFLAQAGQQVLVLEALDHLGGGSWSADTIPGYRFDLHSVAHNMINMTSISAELGLGEVGLAYREMDPFSVGVGADGSMVRFHRSVEATVESIAEVSLVDAVSYRKFIARADKVLDALLPTIRGDTEGSPASAGAVSRLLVAGAGSLATELLRSYGGLLDRTFTTNRVRGPLAAFAAHASVGPDMPRGALFAFWQAAYHRFGQWHARGGSRALIDALSTRLAAWGGETQCSAPVHRIETSAGRVTGVRLESGERIAANKVVAALDPKLALLEMLDPPLGGIAGRELSRTRRSNVVQAVIHIATSELPPYPRGIEGDWNGLQSFVADTDELRTAWRSADAGEVPERLPLYAFTTSAIDDTLTSAGQHTVYLACPATPFRVRGGWVARRDEFVDQALGRTEEVAPGFRASVQGVAMRSPEDMEAGGRWPGAHPMHLDATADQLGGRRPTRRLAHHRTPVGGLYISGAGTAPSGGILGTPGKLAAATVLADLRDG